MNPHEIKFDVYGSNENEYRVVFDISDGFSVHCTCKSAEYDNLCRHILMIISGDDSDVASDNIADVQKVASVFKKSAAYALYEQVINSRIIFEQAKKDAASAKRKLGKSIIQSLHQREWEAENDRDKKSKRKELSWVKFGNDGYAIDWFFLVHTAFKSALDIYFVERSKNKIKYLVETEGYPMRFSFSVGDSVNSRCGNWSLQVDQSTPDGDNSVGNVGFVIYAKNEPSNIYEGIWRRHKWLSTSQNDFVSLLICGKCDVVDLTAT